MNDAELLDLRKRGLSILRIATIAGIPNYEVRERLEELGVKVPLRGRRKVIDAKRLRKLLKQGLNQKQIAQQTGWNPHTIRNWLRSNRGRTVVLDGEKR